MNTQEQKLQMELGSVVLSGLKDSKHVKGLVMKFLLHADAKQKDNLERTLGRRIVSYLESNPVAFRELWDFLFVSCLAVNAHVSLETVNDTILREDVEEAATEAPETSKKTIEDLADVGATTPEQAASLLRELFNIDRTVEYTIRDMYQLLNLKRVAVSKGLALLTLHVDYIKAGISSGKGQPILYRGVAA